MLLNHIAPRCPTLIFYAVFAIMNFVFLQNKAILFCNFLVPISLLFFEMATKNETLTIEEITNYDQITVIEKMMFLSQYSLKEEKTKYISQFRDKKMVLAVDYCFYERHYSVNCLLFLIYVCGITPRIFVFHPPPQTAGATDAV
jgi:hypothetical protein